MIAEMDWIGWIKPFQIFRIEFTLAIGLLAALLLIASQCSIGDWHTNIGESTMADAIWCDRLLHNTYRIELQGDFLRRPTGNTSPVGNRINEKKEVLVNGG